MKSTYASLQAKPEFAPEEDDSDEELEIGFGEAGEPPEYEPIELDYDSGDELERRAAAGIRTYGGFWANEEKPEPPELTDEELDEMQWLKNNVPTRRHSI